MTAQPMPAAAEFLFDAEDRICRAIDQVTAVLALIPAGGSDEQSAAFRFADDARDELRLLLLDHHAAFLATFGDDDVCDDCRQAAAAPIAA